MPIQYLRSPSPCSAIPYDPSMSEPLEMELDRLSLPSTSSTSRSFDEDEINSRTTPYWPKYQHLMESRGFHLDTCRDVQEFYQGCSKERESEISERNCNQPAYIRALCGQHEDELCPDPGLPDNLFRGSRIVDGLKVMVKAVHLRSRELDIIRRLSSRPLRDEPMNHCIPVLDLIEVQDDEIGFIVMEELRSLLVTDPPCCLRLFLCAIRQCIEHTVFLRLNSIAHLDISVRNLLTDNNGHHFFIDYELSRRFEGILNPQICGNRGTEVAPELEQGECGDPFKADIWALGVLILRSCKLTGYYVPELTSLAHSMLQIDPDQRPPASDVLRAFDAFIPLIGEARLQMSSPILRQ